MADPTSTKIDPIHQFELSPVIPQIGLTQSGRLHAGGRSG
jgi:hypothetical protein